MLENICKQAIFEGKKIDLTGCNYGSRVYEFPSQRRDFIATPYPYYFFLAGLVRSQRLANILEIGTHWGGSIMSLSRGLHSQDLGKSKLATVDITYENEEGFKKYPHIKRIYGDALNKKVVKEVVAYFKKDIDLMFIDSVHEYGHVKLCLYIYANMLKPKYIILDDIRYNYSMRKLWSELTNEFGNRAFDTTEISMREREAGLGIIDWGHATQRYRKYKIYWIKMCSIKTKISNRILTLIPKYAHSIQKHP